MPPSADASHPLAGTQDLAKPAQASSVTDVGLADTSQLASGIQVTGLSEELLDLFDSIQQLQQEVAALPQPQHVSPAAPGTQSGQGSEQVLQLSWQLVHAYMSLILHASNLHDTIFTTAQSLRFHEDLNMIAISGHK